MVMTAPKRKAIDEGIDPSHQPTRKVEAMSSLVAEMLVNGADATSPGVPALDVDRAIASAEQSGAHADAAALDMARLIQVESGVVPIAGPRATTPAEESAMLRALRPRSRRVLAVLFVAALVGGLGAAAYFLST